MRKITIGSALAAAAITIAALAGCGTSTITTTGNITTSDPMTVSDGTQIVVTDPSGKVIGTSILHSAPAPGPGEHPFGEYFTFTVTVPEESMYGIQVSGVPGVAWETPAEMQHPSLEA